MKSQNNISLYVPLTLGGCLKKWCLSSYKDYIDIVSFFSTQPSKFLTSLLMIVAFFYSSLSISEIFEDYIHDEKIKNISNKVLYIFSIIISLIVIMVLFNLNIWVLIRLLITNMT